MNWKIYARQGRLYVKEYSAETNLNLYLMLDVSSSMECANTGVSTRLYAAALAAALSVLANAPGDAVNEIRESVLANFYARWKGEALVVDSRATSTVA